MADRSTAINRGDELKVKAFGKVHNRLNADDLRTPTPEVTISPLSDFDTGAAKRYATAAAAANNLYEKTKVKQDEDARQAGALEGMKATEDNVDEGQYGEDTIYGRAYTENAGTAYLDSIETGAIARYQEIEQNNPDNVVVAQAAMDDHLKTVIGAIGPSADAELNEGQKRHWEALRLSATNRINLQRDATLSRINTNMARQAKANLKAQKEAWQEAVYDKEIPANARMALSDDPLQIEARNNWMVSRARVLREREGEAGVMRFYQAYALSAAKWDLRQQAGDDPDKAAELAQDLWERNPNVLARFTYDVPMEDPETGELVAVEVAVTGDKAVEELLREVEHTESRNRARRQDAERMTLASRKQDAQQTVVRATEAYEGLATGKPVNEVAQDIENLRADAIARGADAGELKDIEALRNSLANPVTDKSAQRNALVAVLTRGEEELTAIPGLENLNAKDAAELLRLKSDPRLETPEALQAFNRLSQHHKFNPGEARAKAGPNMSASVEAAPTVSELKRAKDDLFIRDARVLARALQRNAEDPAFDANSYTDKLLTTNKAHIDGRLAEIVKGDMVAEANDLLTQIDNTTWDNNIEDRAVASRLFHVVLPEQRELTIQEWRETDDLKKKAKLRKKIADMGVLYKRLRR